MATQIVRIYAVLIAVLALFGIFSSGHLFELLNTDIALDLLRIALVAYLAYVGFITRSEGMAHTALYIVGTLYIGMAFIGLISSTIGGLLPSGLTGLDIVFHLATGILAVLVAAFKDRNIVAHA